ncbi:GNAT family N-acetyltransferase [uncultured Pelagimonas sp.]|uniref:GNAT family N-acetyltransferase n=1 Tax=uncultured Pelagimonas sp. TaxID=1618102 RepID=UPI00262EE9B3|nr:GNAT family N-acetyltransferase [uncultured Pelagimonas sp.]
MPDPIIRRARRADIQAIVDMLADDPLGATREAAGPPADPAYTVAFDAIDSDPNQFLAVAECDGDIVGVLQLSFIPGLSRRGAWRGQIESVRIHSKARGLGLGQQLFDWAIHTCRSRGCSLVQLTTDKSRQDAHRFYERLGFMASHLGYKRDL